MPSHHRTIPCKFFQSYFSWRQLLLVLLFAIVGTLAAAQSTLAAPPKPAEGPVVLEPEVLASGEAARSVLSATSVICGVQNWYDVAGTAGVFDALRIRLVNKGVLPTLISAIETAPGQFQVVYCVDADRPAQGGLTYCTEESPITGTADEWKLVWFLNHFPPVVNHLSDFSLTGGCGADGLLCQARVQQAARQAVVWRLTNGYVLATTDPALPYNNQSPAAGADVDAALLTVYNALWNAIPAQPPAEYVSGAVALTIDPPSATNQLPAESSHTVTVQLSKGGVPLVGKPVTVSVSSVPAGIVSLDPASGNALTDGEGKATFTLSSSVAGEATIVASAVVTVPKALHFTVADDPSEQPMGNGGYDTITVEATAAKTWLADSEPVCEAKETQDCITVELLSVVTNADGTKTYQWKVTSDCNRALSYIAFALPPGVVAVSPVDGAVVRGSVTNYKVENPTNNPFYSIKFESQGEGIRDGQSEVFSYTLPAGVSIPDTITVEAKYSTTRTQLILNTENCDDNSTPPPPPVDPDCQICDGKVTQMTLRYEGTQAATIRVEQKKEGVIFEQIVQPAETFTLYGTDKQATLGTEVSIYIDGILNTKIHTSCSQPIGPGLTFGSFTLVEAYSRNGGLTCPVPSRNTAGQPAGTLFQLFIPSVNLDQ